MVCAQRFSINFYKDPLMKRENITRPSFTINKIIIHKNRIRIPFPRSHAHPYKGCAPIFDKRYISWSARLGRVAKDVLAVHPTVIGRLVAALRK